MTRLSRACDPIDTRLRGAYRASPARDLYLAAHRAQAERYVDASRPPVVKRKSVGERIALGMASGAWGVACALVLWWAWDSARIVEQVTRFFGG